jgi:WXXGXW repeat (2 copies)
MQIRDHSSGRQSGTLVGLRLEAVGRAAERIRPISVVPIGPDRVTRVAVAVVASALLAAAMLVSPVASYARIAVGVSVTIAPPPLPVYAQPICPGPGYIWTPGYWAWDPADGYYWVPGTWVEAPFVGALWTPGYWDWDDGVYLWHAGYWGPDVGFYGGINYGFGYLGVGYLGGYWNRGNFYYNTAVDNVSRTNITNVYNKTVVNNITVNNVSYHGGSGGIAARPTPAQLAATRARRDPPTFAQRQQEQAARANRAQFVSVNRGQPPVAAVRKPGEFKGPGVVRARRAGGPLNAALYSAAAKRTSAGRPVATRAASQSKTQAAATRPQATPTNRSTARSMSPRRDTTRAANTHGRNAARSHPRITAHAARPPAPKPPERRQYNPPNRPTSYHSSPRRATPAARRPTLARPARPARAAQPAAPSRPPSAVRRQAAPRSTPRHGTASRPEPQRAPALRPAPSRERRKQPPQ